MQYLLSLLEGLNAVEPGQDRSLVICGASSIQLPYGDFRNVTKATWGNFSNQVIRAVNVQSVQTKVVHES